MLKNATIKLLIFSIMVTPYLVWSQSLQAEEFVVVGGNGDYTEPVKQLENYLGWMGTRAYRQRSEENLAVQSTGQAESYRRGKYDPVHERCRPFPRRKTPLNATIHGTIDCGDYSIEKLSYESRPGYIVTANLYVPKKFDPPFPDSPMPVGSLGR